MNPRHSGPDSIANDANTTPHRAPLPREDCLACRVTGTLALTSVGIYALNMSRAHKPGTIIGKRIMAGVGVLFLGAGVLRATVDPRGRF